MVQERPVTEDHRLIPLTQGQSALVSPEDYKWLMQWKWRAMWDQKQRQFKATRTANHQEILMHRFILGLVVGDKRQGDHINGNTLDNRRTNLRIATNTQNSWNVGKKRSNTTGYKGIAFHRQSNTWVAQIRVGGRRLCLGYFKTPELAGQAYAEAAVKHHGEFARIA